MSSTMIVSDAGGASLPAPRKFLCTVLLLRQRKKGPGRRHSASGQAGAQFRILRFARLADRSFLVKFPVSLHLSDVRISRKDPGKSLRCAWNLQSDGILSVLLVAQRCLPGCTGMTKGKPPMR